MHLDLGWELAFRIIPDNHPSILPLFIILESEGRSLREQQLALLLLLRSGGGGLRSLRGPGVSGQPVGHRAPRQVHALPARQVPGGHVGPTSGDAHQTPPERCCLRQASC